MNEDCNAHSDCPMTDYNEIDEAGCLVASSTNKEDMFHEGKKKKRDVYNTRTNYVILKFKVEQRFQDVVECKVVVRKWDIHNGYNVWFKKCKEEN